MRVVLCCVRRFEPPAGLLDVGGHSAGSDIRAAQVGVGLMRRKVATLLFTAAALISSAPKKTFTSQQMLLWGCEGHTPHTLHTPHTPRTPHTSRTPTHMMRRRKQVRMMTMMLMMVMMVITDVMNRSVYQGSRAIQGSNVDVSSVT